MSKSNTRFACGIALLELILHVHSFKFSGGSGEMLYNYFLLLELIRPLNS